MAHRWRTAGAVLASLVMLATLTSCQPAVYHWVYLSSDGTFQLGGCENNQASAVRVELSVGTSDEVLASSILSGPWSDIPEGSSVGDMNLPDGWMRSNELDFSVEWDKLAIKLYDAGELVDVRYADREDLTIDAWSLSPPSSVIFPAPECERPGEVAVPEMDTVAQAITAGFRTETESLAMGEDEFWQLMETVDTSTMAASISQLEERLALLPDADIIGFHAQLVLQLDRLDTAEVFNRAEIERNQQQEHWLNGSEWFLESRLLTIAFGRDAVSAVLSEGASPSFANYFYATELLDVAQNAFLSSDRTWDAAVVALPVSVGANTDGW